MAEPFTAPVAGPPAGPVEAPRRRRRTGLLFTVAGVLGVLAGAGTGYGIQRDRPPTPLPPLTAHALVRPPGPGPAEPALPASEDRGTVYRGNLLTELVPVPKGMKLQRRDWMPLYDYADRFVHPEKTYPYLVSNGFQRGAAATWGDPRTHTVYTVELTQYRDEVSPFTSEHTLNQQGYAAHEGHLGRRVHVPGTYDGAAWGSGRPEQDPGYVPIYTGEGLATVGNIEVEVWIASPRPVPGATVLAVMKRQLERL